MDEGTPLRCRQCDYDLRGIETERCPECGCLRQEAPPDAPLRRGCRYAFVMLLVGILCLGAALLALTGPRSVAPVGPIGALVLLGLAWLLLRNADPPPAP